jgi:tape measure domain-containing protein
LATVANLSVVLGLSTAPFRAGLATARSALRAFSVELNTVFARVGPFTFRMGPGAAGIGALVAGIAKLGIEAIKAAADFEQMETALTGLTGSAERAKAIMEDMAQFAAVTPLEFKDVARSTQMLTAVGVEAESALNMVKKLGDISASMPGDMAENLQRVVRALADMHTKGTVQAEEMTRQLANAGIPAWDALAKQIGRTREETIALTREGLVPARDGIMAILKLAEDSRFAGAQERQAQGLIGLWSTLKDNVAFFMRDLGKIIVEGFGLKDSTRSLTTFFGFLRSKLEEIKPAIMAIGTVFRTVFEVALSLVKQVVNEFAKWTSGIDSSPASLEKLREATINTLEGVTEAIIRMGTEISNTVIRLNNLLGGVEGVGRGLERWWLGMQKIFVEAGGALNNLPEAQMEGARRGLEIAKAEIEALAKKAEPMALLDADLAVAKMRDALARVRGGGFGLIGPEQIAQFGDRLADMMNHAMAREDVRFAIIRPVENSIRDITARLTGFATVISTVFKKVSSDVNLPFTGFSKQLQDALKATQSPLKEYADNWKRMNKEIADNTLAGFALMARGNFAMLVNVAMAQNALKRKMGEDLEELRKKFGPSSACFTAMERGSKEAADAIGRALNRRENARQGPEDVMKNAVKIAGQQLKELIKIGEQVKDAGKNMGLW